MNGRRAAWALVLPLFAVTLLAGCTAGGPSYVKTKFQDADQRIAQAADGGYSQYWDVVVPPATPALTVRASMLADQGIGFALRNPGGRLTTSFTFPAATEVPELTWVELRRPAPGTWRLGVDCGRRCDFSFGFYLHDAIPKGGETARTYDDATVRFAEDTDGTSNRLNQFRLPPGVQSLSIRATLSADDALILRLEDPAGHVRTALAFPDRARLDDADFLVMHDPPSGTWSFRAECRNGCAYGVGAYLA